LTSVLFPAFAHVKNRNDGGLEKRLPVIASARHDDRLARRCRDVIAEPWSGWQ
jgi:hypothetical protein